MKKFAYLVLLLSITTLYAKTTRIMPLGDSITYDDTHADHEVGGRTSGERTAYRSHLWYMLEDANYSADFVGSVIAGQDIVPKFDPENEGHPGWTSFEIAEITYKTLSKNRPSIILLHIGTNDHDSDISGIEDILNQVDLYEKEYKENVKVYVALIIDRKYADYLIKYFNENLENLIYKRILKGDNLVLVDMYNGAHLTSSDYIENTHPNSEGYKKMAQKWFKSLTEPYTAKLHAFPASLINTKYIQTNYVDEKGKTITFTIQMPKDSITF